MMIKTSGIWGEWCTLAVSMMVVLGASVANAAGVAVVPVRYIDAATGKTVAEAANKVEDRLVSKIEQAGYRVHAGVSVADAFSTESHEGICERTCLQRIAGRLGVSEVVYVDISDDEQLSYKVKVTFAAAPPPDDVIERERTDGFYVVLEWLQGEILLALKKNVYSEREQARDTVDAHSDSSPKEEDAAAKNENGAETAVVEQQHTDATTVAADGGNKRLSLRPLVVSGVVTGLLGGTFLIVDGVSNRQFKDLESRINKGDAPVDTGQQLDDIERLQRVEKVFLGMTIAGLVTTGVLALFTDFGQERASSTSAVSVRLSGLGLSGSF